MRFPLLSDDPIETLIAVVDIRQQAHQAGCHLLTYTNLNVLVALVLGQTMTPLILDTCVVASEKLTCSYDAGNIRRGTHRQRDATQGDIGRWNLEDREIEGHGGHPTSRPTSMNM